MTLPRPNRRSFLAGALTAAVTGPVAAQQGGPARILWINATPEYPPVQNDGHRRQMADYLGALDGGGRFAVTFAIARSPGAVASAFAGGPFDVVVIDATDRRSHFGPADLDALRGHYGSGRRAIMLDGSLWIRSTAENRTTEFPGVNGATGALLVNQVQALLDAGGGTLIGTDHDDFQTAANAALTALVPGARFSGTTNPSTDGDFIGRTLLAHDVPLRAIDILEHWQSIPTQGETPVGAFTDFMGQPVRLYALVETADKPGGGVKRPYVSASFDPGSERTAIDAAEAAFEAEPEPPRLPENMPTRKGPPA